MARSIGMALENPTPVYRAVILSLYPGIHNRTLKTYTTADGQEFQYHSVSAYGPYGTRAPASAQITQAFRHHDAYVKAGHYTTRRTYNRQTQSYDIEYDVDTVPELTAFVEEQVPSWNPVAQTIRTA